MKVPLDCRFHRPRAGCSIGVLLFLAVLLPLLGGCATGWQVPQAFDDSALRARAQTATSRDVRLSAAVLSAADSRRFLGVDVNAAAIQPVWIEVRNDTDQALWLLRVGTDPDYFSPLEVAWSYHAPLAGSRNAAIDGHFDALAFENPIPPGTTRAGIIYATRQERTRLLNVDLLGRRQLIPFTLFLPVPDSAINDSAVQRLTRASERAIDYADLDALRAALERLPSVAEGVGGEPANVILVGRIEDLAAAVVRRGYRRASLPIDDAQHLFGRSADIVLRKSGDGAPAQWLRLWLAPLRFQGQPVLLAQVGRPVGGRFASAQGGELRLHPDVDEARNLLIQDMAYSGGLQRFGFVSGAGRRLRADDKGGGFFTDGLRAVMFFVTRPLDLSDLQLVDWDSYPRDRIGAAAQEAAHERQ